MLLSLLKNKKYIKNIKSILRNISKTCFLKENDISTSNEDNSNNKNESIDATMKTETKIRKYNHPCDKSDFSISFGPYYAIFELKKYDKSTIMNFTRKIFEYLHLDKQLSFLKKSTSIDEAIISARSDANSDCIEAKLGEKKQLNEIKWSTNNNDALPKQISDIKTKLHGVFKISEIVTAIKCKQIKLPNNFKLYQIFSNDIEMYPNINFYDAFATDPIVVIEKEE